MNSDWEWSHRNEPRACVTTPVAMGAGDVADEPTVKRLLLAVLAVAFAMSALLGELRRLSMGGQ